MATGDEMLRELAGTMLAGAVDRPPGAPRADPLATTLIGTGATLVMTRGRRAVGIVLLAAGGYLALRDVRRARAAAALNPADARRPAPPAPPAASVPAAR